MVMLKRVLNARVHEVLPQPTPLERASSLSERLGVNAWLKREDQTPVFSFKLRGAYNRIALMNGEERQRGVVAASAGNHAQGVAFACQRLDIPCVVVMPRTTPRIKVDAVRRYGCEVQLWGDSYSDAAVLARELVESSGRLFIPPFDDLEVIAGQGTVGLELLQQAPRDLEAIFVPVGGGGLASGIAAVVKEVRPRVAVIGVEPDDSNAMQQALRHGGPLELPRVGIFADGVAVKRVGELTFQYCQRYLDDVVLCSSDEICAAIRDVFLDTRTMLEPAGALSVAGMKTYLKRRGAATGSYVAIASGANMAYTRFGYVLERAEIGEQREAILAVEIPERRGSFLDFCSLIGERPITEFNYRLSSRKQARIFVGMEVEGRAEIAAILQALRARGYATDDLSADDVAKTHVRHMVGGRSPLVGNEVLYDFEFPERPGALMHFLRKLSHRWNISLFHYRNHGAAYGRVLCGMEVPPADRPELERVLEAIGFEHRAVHGGAAAKFLLDPISNGEASG